jgi:hypothetical protein
MTKRSSVESRELIAAPAIVQPPAADDADGWQDWPADDSDPEPIVLPPIRRRPHLGTVRLSIVASFDAGDRPVSTEEIVVTATIDKSAAHHPAFLLQRFALTAAAAALLALATAVSASAQESAAALPTPGHITEAPIGHRQPHEWQLPRKVQRDEGHRTEHQTEFDKELRICRGCW